MEIFLSYARPDRSKADAVAGRLRQAGNTVWLDTERAGGASWWDEILRQLRRCDATVVVVSKAALRSQACIRERQYAASLGKHVLPLAIEPFSPELLPSDLALLQVIDYSRPDEAAAFKLAGAIIRLPRPPALPDPLPKPPPAPVSPLDNIAEQLKSASLSQDQQLAIIGKLESALAPSADPNDRPVAVELLTRMVRRDDLFADVDRRATALRAGVPEQPMTQWPSAPPPRPAASPAWAQQATPSPQPSAWTSYPTASPQPAPGYPQPMPGSPVADLPVPHWAMAIASLIFFFPVGIPAIIMAQRTKASLEAGDLETAHKSARTVKILFWVVVGIWIVVALSRA